MTGFWHTFSERLTEVAFDVDWKQPHDVSFDVWAHRQDTRHDHQPHETLLPLQGLKQLTALTNLSFKVTTSPGQGLNRAGDRLDLPKLKVLRFEGYCGRRLDLDCPNLTSLTFADCWGMRHMSLQAPLQGFHVRSSGIFRINAIFPLSNLMDLVSLNIECGVDD